MEYHQEHLLLDCKACRGLQMEEEKRMVNTWYMAKDSGKETAKKQVVQVTKASGASPQSLYEQGKECEDNANKWREITLLLVLCKVFCRVLLLIIEAAFGSKLEQEQLGFRKSRGCIEQIFALRNIIERCLE